MKIVDEIKKIASIELKSINLPLAVKTNIEPPVGLKVENNWLVQTVEMIWLRPSIDSKLESKY